jgi:hypothetical protein
VILMCRRSPARGGLGANAPQVLQRAAELIPNQLKLSAPPRLHPCGLTRMTVLSRPRSLEGGPIADCYLTMPVDPTSEKDSEWFKKMPEAVIADMFEDATLALTKGPKAQIASGRDRSRQRIAHSGLPTWLSGRARCAMLRRRTVPRHC